MLRIAMDGRALADASSYRGIGTYLRTLLPRLAARPDVSVTVLAPPAVAGSLPDGVALAAHRRVAPDRWATAEHHLRLPRELSRVAADVDHSPALDPPRTRGGGRGRSRPWVQTVADVLALIDPDPAFSVERRRWQRWAPRVRAADAVITFSSFAAEEVTRELGLAPERVHVIPLPAGARFTPPLDDGPGGRRPYVLFVSEYGPHKGYPEAAAVAAQLGAAGLPHRVAMAGRVVPATAPLVRAAVSAAGDRVELLGWVGDLVPLYQGAAALLVTSRHEGYGLPAVEAMACATPVVAFDNSATTEVVDSGGVLVPDGDVDAATRALVSLLSSSEHWRAASAAARGRAACLAQVDVAARHVDVYRHVAGA